MVYLVILGSGARLEHVIEMINSWRPEEEIYVEYLNRNIKRLECFEEHYRYYMGKETDIKPVGFIFFPRLLIPLIKIFRGKIPNRRNVYKKARKVDGLPSMYIRIFAMREMKKVISDPDVYRFIVSKFSELGVSARHYMNLLEEADRVYPKYAERWLEIVNKALPNPPGDFLVLVPKKSSKTSREAAARNSFSAIHVTAWLQGPIAFLHSDRRTCIYHYLPPDVISKPTEELVKVLEERLRPVIQEFNINLHVGDIWTTDVIFRQTRDKVKRYSSKGVLAVDMESTGLMAIAMYRMLS